MIKMFVDFLLGSCRAGCEIAFVLRLFWVGFFVWGLFGLFVASAIGAIGLSKVCFGVVAVCR